MEQQPMPISIPEVLTSVRHIIADIQLKNTTLINYYIHPSPIPTEVSAYEPRIKVIENRIAKLSRLNYRSMQMLFDGFPILLAVYIVQNLVQLIHACRTFQDIFINHYDRRLEQSIPYNSMYQKLHYFHDALRQFHALQQSTRQFPAEMSLPSLPAAQPSICPGAVGFLNNRDQGKISHVDTKDLLSYHKTRLADRGGVFLWWECSHCAFRLRYHASHSLNLNINSTDETAVEEVAEDIVYRSSWLVKCHVRHYLREAPKPKKKSPSPSPSPPLAPKSPNPKKEFGRTSRIYFVRRVSTKAGPSSSKPKEKDKEKDKEASKPKKPATPPPPPPPCGPYGLRFFCPFCVAHGLPISKGPRPKKAEKCKSKEKDDESSSDESSGYEGDEGDQDAPTATCFTTSAAFIEHIEDKHLSDRPVPLLLLKLKVAVMGEMAPFPDGRPTGGKWDLDMRWM